MTIKNNPMIILFLVYNILLIQKVLMAVNLQQFIIKIQIQNNVKR
jgi:hypothetical protein